MTMIATLIATAAFAAAPADRIAAAKDLVASQMKDPGSTQFRAVRVGVADYVCGEVNAKNSYGGYVGFTPFVVSDEGEVSIISSNESDNIATNLSISLFCHEG